MIVNTDIFHPRELTEEQKQKYGCDVMFASNRGKPTEEIIEEDLLPFLAPYGFTRELLFEIHDKLWEEYRAEKTFTNYNDLLPFLMTNQDFAAAYSSLSNDDQNNVLQRIFWKLNDTIYRYVVLEWLDDYAQSHPDFKLHLHGNEWRRHPRFSKYDRGPLPHGEMLDSAYNSAKYCLHLNALESQHQRLNEILNSGSTPLTRLTPEHYAQRDLTLRNAQQWLWARLNRLGTYNPTAFQLEELADPLQQEALTDWLFTIASNIATASLAEGTATIDDETLTAKVMKQTTDALAAQIDVLILNWEASTFSNRESLKNHFCSPSSPSALSPKTNLQSQNGEQRIITTIINGIRWLLGDISISGVGKTDDIIEPKINISSKTSGQVSLATLISIAGLVADKNTVTLAALASKIEYSTPSIRLRCAEHLFESTPLLAERLLGAETYRKLPDISRRIDCLILKGRIEINKMRDSGAIVPCQFPILIHGLSENMASSEELAKFNALAYAISKFDLDIDKHIIDFIISSTLKYTYCYIKQNDFESAHKTLQYQYNFLNDIDINSRYEILSFSLFLGIWDIFDSNLPFITDKKHYSFYKAIKQSCSLQFTEAHTEIDIELHEHPNSAPAIIFKAHLYYCQGLYKAAVQLIDKSTEHNHALEDDLINYGHEKAIILRAMGRIPESRSIFNKFSSSVKPLHWEWQFYFEYIRTMHAMSPLSEEPRVITEYYCEKKLYYNEILSLFSKRRIYKNSLLFAIEHTLNALSYSIFPWTFIHIVVIYWLLAVSFALKDSFPYKSSLKLKELSRHYSMTEFKVSIRSQYDILEMINMSKQVFEKDLLCSEILILSDLRVYND